MDFKTLKARQREERENYPINLGLRVHRALSWLDRAEQSDDDDARFIFLWIAFNAAYANDIGDRERDPEQKVFGKFLEKLVNLDVNRSLYELIWTEFSNSIRVLLDNHFVFSGKSVHLLKKEELNLHDTFISLDNKKPETVLRNDRLREAGLGDLMVELGILSQDKKSQLESKIHYGD